MMDTTADYVVPVIPPVEYRQRWQRVHELMGEHRLDLLLAYADDRAVFGPAHARWLADLPVQFEPPIFGPSNSARIEKDMVISIDIPLFDAPWGGLRVEGGYLIGESGAEHLNLTPYVIEK